MCNGIFNESVIYFNGYHSQALDKDGEAPAVALDISMASDRIMYAALSSRATVSREEYLG